MRSVRLKKQYGDVTLNNVFELVKNESPTSLALNINAFISDARETVCVALGDGMNDSLAQTLSSVKSRVYTLVPQIDESKYAKLRGKAIVREVPKIKGNYCLIDDKVFKQSLKLTTEEL